MTPLVDEIKASIRRCQSVVEVNEVAKRYAAEVAALDRQGGDLRVMALQIRNLAAYQREMILKGAPTWWSE